VSEENIEVVRRAYEALEDSGIDAWEEFLAPDVGHRAIEGAPDDRGPLHGRDEVRAYLEEWFQMFDDFKVQPLEFVDAGGDKVVYVLRFGGKAKQSGVETDQTLAIVYTVRDGKIAQGREYATREEALEAAGVRD
jgi:ketosteroid isomerase-like protein